MKVMKNLVMVNVAGSNGYSFVVECDKDDEAIDRALKAGLFIDDEDAEYATTDLVFEDDYNHFKNDIVKV